MEAITDIYGFLISEYGGLGLATALIAVAMLIVQVCYFVSYGRIASYRRPRREGAQELPVSVIIPMFHADFNYLQSSLPLFLNQSHAQYEIIVVDVAGDEDFSEQLKLMMQTYPQLRTTKLTCNERFPINNKMALNVGIKAARYEQVVITTADCVPSTGRWLELMARGFATGAEVVLGYCGVDGQSGFGKRLMRLSRVAVSARWIRHAMKHKPYRGNIGNLGFTRSAYFAAHGFNHLNLNIGEDDLFVMKLAGHDNTAVVVSGAASMRQTVWGGMRAWHTARRNLSYTYRYYPSGVKRSIAVELWSRGVFFAACIILIAAMPLYGKIFGAGILLLRYLIVRFEMWRICRRLSERHLLSALSVYDFFAPLCELELALTRRLKHSDEIWR